MKSALKPLDVYDLLVHDDGKLNVEEDYLVFQGESGRKTLEHYLHGNCHLMALALHQVSGLPLCVFVELEAFWDDSDTPLTSSPTSIFDRRHRREGGGFLLHGAQPQAT